MIHLVPRIACLFLGYLFGCILTACFVVKLTTGKSISEFGTGNPGMANVMANVGFRTGIIVLIGDLLKTVVVCVLCLYLFGADLFGDPSLSIGQIAALWAGVGAVIGHNWPFWRKFSGGKGVAVTCMAIFLFNPICGLIADLAGMLTVMGTGYLPLGAVVITIVFTILTYLFCNPEAALLAVVLMVIMFSRHYRGLFRILKGKEEKTQLFARFKKPAKTRDPDLENMSGLSGSGSSESGSSGFGSSESGSSGFGSSESGNSGSGSSGFINSELGSSEFGSSKSARSESENSEFGNYES